MPSVISGWEKVEVGVQRRMSHSMASSHPPPSCPSPARVARRTGVGGGGGGGGGIGGAGESRGRGGEGEYTQFISRGMIQNKGEP